MKITDIQFTDEDRTNKGMRKDLNYLNKLFKGDLPEWLVGNVMKVRRNDNNKDLGLLNSKALF